MPKTTTMDRSKQLVRSLPSDANISGRNFGLDELDNLKQVLDSGTLNCTRGTWVKRFEEQFCEKYGVDYIYVGVLERRDFPAAGIEKFARNLTPIYEDERNSTAIYSVPGEE